MAKSVNVDKKAIFFQKGPLNIEQHEFEKHWFIYLWIFLNKYIEGFLQICDNLGGKSFSLITQQIILIF